MHLLVRVAFHLANDGFDGETLFGALSCLLAMVNYRAYIFKKADVTSLDQTRATDFNRCRHAPVTALQYAEDVPTDTKNKWAKDARLGWSVFVATLRYTVVSLKEEHRQEGLEDLRYQKLREDGSTCSEDESEYGEEQLNNATEQVIDGRSIKHNRKISDDDPEISPRFSMGSLFTGLKRGEGPTNVEYIEKGLVMETSEKGYFEPKFGPRAMFTKTYMGLMHFANIHPRGRAKFIEAPIFD
ncbi:hypothetical protein F5Y15DRAFT_414553 [Xylariaceae sp. FL0016]|nr:hypothetical protein F5Y15DRAFT_414553 [Xylariaceae sp. FL0016]